MLLHAVLPMAPSSPLLAGFAVQSLLVVSLSQLASLEEGSSWEYSCALHQRKTVSKYLGR